MSTTTLSGDWQTYNLDTGPFWADNDVWNNGGLVNGPDYTQSITVTDGSFPNGTTITWNWPNTANDVNVYSFPEVRYGQQPGYTAPANNITSEQISNIKTLTLNDNISLTGDPNTYDVIYDFSLTSAAGADSPQTHEIEVYLHTPNYSAGFINNLPHQSFMAADGVQWTIAENNGNPSLPMVIFEPTGGQDLTNNSVDLKALFQAAVADGYLSGSEYFDGLGFGVEPQKGGGSLTINSFSVNYDGDPNGATPVPSPMTNTSPPPAADPPATTDPANQMAANNPSTAGSSTSVTDTTTHNQTTAPDPASTTSSTSVTDTTHNQTTAPDPASTTSSTSVTDTTTHNQTTAPDPASTTSSTSVTDTTTQNQTNAPDPSSSTSSTSVTDTTAHNQTTAPDPSSVTSSTSVTNLSPATATDQDAPANPQQNGGHHHHLHHDIAALLQALQQNNTSAVNNAVTALGNDVHAASAADSGSAPSFTDHHIEHCTHHFEHMWG